MSLVKKRHTALAVKSLLALSYLLFFTIQINARYFSVANFFTYSSKASSSSIASELPTSSGAGKMAHRKIFKVSPRQAGNHLALDKRFDNKDFVKTALFRYPVPVAYEVSPKQFFFFSGEHIISADPPVLTLRGPPCA